MYMYQEGFSHLYQLEEVFKMFLVVHSDLTVFLDDPIVLYLSVVTGGRVGGARRHWKESKCRRQLLSFCVQQKWSTFMYM